MQVKTGTRATCPRPASSAAPTCRFCGSPLRASFVDLGMSPPCQNVVRAERLHEPETFYPLHAYVCGECLLVQLQDLVAPADIFTEYAYFSSYSSSWVAHARRYVESMIDRLNLTPRHLVIEIASNDGYLLQHFVERRYRVLGIEPAANVAMVAIERGIPCEVRFFGRETAAFVAERHGRPKLLIGNNVLAHVPDINDFVAGVKLLLAPDGVITVEFPHLLQLMRQNQFDTIYHEHFSYLSFVVAERIFAHHGLTVFDVEELPTHGGSLRLFARHAGCTVCPVTLRVPALRQREVDAGIESLSHYEGFAAQVQSTKRELLRFLIEAKSEGRKVVGYGAPGKGNTLLNYCGVRTDFLEFTVDANPYKQGTFTPGTRIPVLAPEAIRRERPDYVLILPWNLREEIAQTVSYIREWGGKFVVPIPRVEVF